MDPRKGHVCRAASVALALFFGAAGAHAQQQPPPQQPAPSQTQNAPPPAPSPPPRAAPAPPAANQATPPSAQWVAPSAGGQWVFTSEHGWLWVPGGTTTTVADGVPYVYLYTPSVGWTWYVSPWGPGRYHYGAWVRRTWHPAGWHGAWVATPRVFTRLGGHTRLYRR